MLSGIKNILRRHHRNYTGWKTSRKIVVIESDDWGSIRMPSKQVYRKFLEAGVPVDESSYCRYDSLATAEDLEALFSILTKFKDANNNHPVITANAVMANPDFERIRDTDFEEYFYEKFTDTLKRYPGCENSFELWEEGIENEIFYPQFHGREHINVPLWLKLLQQNHDTIRRAFDHEFWGLSNGILADLEQSIQASYDCSSEEALDFQNQSIIEGLNLFEEIFGFRSESFIANNYIWHPVLEKILSGCGVNYIQGMKYQIQPKDENGKRMMIRHPVGDQNEFGQIYLMRNCVFEPSLKGDNFNSVQECLNDVSNAFLWKKPAIITIHRLNFMGSLDSGNRMRNLKKFSKLLSEVIERWPEVEFLTSEQLGRCIKEDKKISDPSKNSSVKEIEN